MSNRRSWALLALLTVMLSVLACDIAGAGKDAADTEEEIDEFLEEANEKLEEFGEMLLEDGLSFAKAIRLYSECRAEGYSESWCEDDMRQALFTDCLENHDFDYCDERYRK